MTKMNYNEPEFKVIVARSADVIATSALPVVTDPWNTAPGGEGAGAFDPSEIGFGV